MCGIAGYHSAVDIDHQAVIQSMAHRGPDGHGAHHDGDVHLLHRRLAIIDLALGLQPMTSADGQVTIIFNGEIYNYRELNRRLAAEGCHLRTQSDTETLLHLYDRHGTDMLRHLNGMFAFVLHDRRKGLLFGARDRLGIKPLYWAHNDRGFFFASEIKSILATGQVSRRADLVSLDHYLTHRFVPGDRTCFAEVAKVPPAHAFTQEGDRPPVFWRYWDFPSEGGGPADLEQALEGFQELLTDAVRLRLIADVPLGIFLSGGVDSTTITGIMSQLGHQPIQSFSLGFGQPLDETADAELSARHFGCQHLSFLAEPQALELMPQAIWHMDEPFGDVILVALLLLSQKAGQEVKVVLTGEGADEGQYGYVHHEALAKGLGLAGRLPQGLLSLAGSLVKRLPVAFLDRFFKYPASMGQAGRQRLGAFLGDLGHPGRACLGMISLFGEDEKRALYGPRLAQAHREGQAQRQAWARELDASGDPLGALYRHDFQHWLPDNILNKMDRMTMAASIEGRVPFLDHRLVEFLVGLPRDLKLRQGHGKHLLRELFQRRYTPPGRKPGPKKAFYWPLEGVFQEAFTRFKTQWLRPGRLPRELVDPAALSGLLNRGDDSRLLHDKQLTALASLAIWLERLEVALD